MIPSDVMIDEIRRIFVANVTNNEESVDERKIREKNITTESCKEYGRYLKNNIILYWPWRL